MCLEAFANQDNIQIYIKKASGFHIAQMKICHREVILWVFGKMDCDRHGDVVLWKKGCNRLSSFISYLGSPSPSLFSLLPGVDLTLKRSFLCKDSFFFLPESVFSAEPFYLIAMIKDRGCFYSSSGLLGNSSKVSPTELLLGHLSLARPPFPAAITSVSPASQPGFVWLGRSQLT